MLFQVYTFTPLHLCMLKRSRHFHPAACVNASPLNPVSLSCLPCSVHHGLGPAGLPLWPELHPGQVLLRGLGHLLRRRVPDRLGLHAGYRGSHADAFPAVLRQICTQRAAVSHPFAHPVIVQR